MTHRLLAAGSGFAPCVALSAVVDQQQADAFLLGLATAFLAAFVGGFAARLGERDLAIAAVTAVAGAAVVSLYGALAAEHLLVPSDIRHIEGWMLAVSFLQAVLLVAGGLGIGGGLGRAALGLALAQLVAAALLVFEGTDGVGIRLAAAAFALWVAAAAISTAREPARRPVDGEPPLDSRG